MDLAKSLGRRNNRTAGQQVKKRTKRNSASGQEFQEFGDEPSNDGPARAIQQTLETSLWVEPDDIAVDGLDLSYSLMQLAADDDGDSSVQPETEADGSTRFDIVDDVASTYRPGAFAETSGTTADLVDPSKWFEYNDADFSDERVADQHITLSEESSSNFTGAITQGITSDDTAAMNDTAVTNDISAMNDIFAMNDISAMNDTAAVNDTAVMDVNSSTASYADEMGGEVIDSATAQATETARKERRKHPREDSSDLVWVEYFNSSMESLGKEAARVENFGAGGMRLGAGTAPAELERVIVSYPYRGFESCSIVRSRYQGENGQERLCLQFVDREWKLNATCAPVENAADQVNPRKILLADDDSAFRKILGNMLIRAGYDVVLAEDGASAVEKATRELPDLVITDGLMPKLHGFQVCRAVKELNPQPKVIMLTAVYTSPNYMWEVKAKFGADDIITKPCQIDDLLRTIEKHVPVSRQFV